jgi:hypothetical protein
MNSSGARFAHIATVISKTEASWAAFPNMSCIDLALDPNDAGHFILVRITRGLHVWETTDGGDSFHSLGKNSIYHIGIDRQGWLYTAVRRDAFGCNVHSTCAGFSCCGVGGVEWDGGWVIL